MSENCKHRRSHKIPARGRVITVIYITQKTINILIHKCNKQYTSNLQKLDWYISMDMDMGMDVNISNYD
jgi:hypothetical protein